MKAGNRPQPVATDGLELRLRFDEGKGDLVRNSAPGAKVGQFKADTNPLIWGENTWLWPSMRMDIQTRLSLGDSGDVEAGEKFSTGGWIMLRAKPGGGVRTGTGNGSLLARMGDEKRRGGAGWDIYQEGLLLFVNLVPDSTQVVESDTGAVSAPSAAPAAEPAPATKRKARRAAWFRRPRP